MEYKEFFFGKEGGRVKVIKGWARKMNDEWKIWVVRFYVGFMAV